MPLPKPRPNEQRQAFVSRCMGDSVMRTEYQNQDQRSAVCYSLFDRPSHKSAPEYADSEIGDRYLNLDNEQKACGEEKEKSEEEQGDGQEGETEEEKRKRLEEAEDDLED